MPYPIGSIINQVPHAPYNSQREALLYEILQSLGGNPEQIMSKNWTPGNEGNDRPPYTSLTDALLYEIWMVTGNDPGGGGGGGETSIIFYGLIKDGATIVPDEGLGSKIVKAASNYYIVPPAITNLAGNELQDVRLWIAEPITEPTKAATLWLRNIASTFINDAIAPAALMTAEIIGDYRVYKSEAMDAQMFNGQILGPVFCSQFRQVNVDFGVIIPPPPDPSPYNFIIQNTDFNGQVIDAGIMPGMAVAWFFIDGYYPVTPGISASGTHTIPNGALAIQVNNVIATGKMQLLINDVVVECVTIAANGIYSFGAQIFDVDTNIKIRVSNGAC